MARINFLFSSFAIATLFVVLSASHAQATPFYAISAGHACNTCHVEPIGWANPEQIAARRCTMDCQGCHVSPTGGGLRTPLGSYYAGEELAMWGPRPSDSANPMRFADPNAPVEGRYRLFGGFEGWWPGEVQHRTIEDRYGNIDPAPTWQIGGDYRALAVLPTDSTTGRDPVAFPMAVQTYLAVHPTPNLTAYLDLGFQGSTDRSIDNLGGDNEDLSFFSDVLWVRELFVMMHDLPNSLYVRGGRFALPYGWRLPDHTAYTRAGLFDQYRQAYGVEVGIAPNEWWGNLALTYQGVDAWPGETTLQQGGGLTAQGGWRGLGYSLGSSVQVFGGRDGYREFMAGPMWGVNLHPFTYLGELDWRRTEQVGGGKTSLYALHEVQFIGIRGLTPKTRYEWLDADTRFRDDHVHRFQVGLEWNILAQLQLDTSWRRAFTPGAEVPNASELLLQIHGHF